MHELLLRANGLRYPQVGGTREHHFAGIDFKPRKLPENAQTPTSRVHLRRMGASYFTEETNAPGKVYCQNGRRMSRTLAVVSGDDSRGAPWFLVTMIYQLVA